MLHVHKSIAVLKLSKIELVMVLEINASFKFYIRNQGRVNLADFLLRRRTVTKKRGKTKNTIHESHSIC